jgi:Arc/MetJ-type ribon-helix-helix transcriptional regulator
MGKRKDLVYWNIPVTKSLDTAVQEAIRRDMHNTRSDLVREAVREKLEKMAVYLRPHTESSARESEGR